MKIKDRCDVYKRFYDKLLERGKVDGYAMDVLRKCQAMGKLTKLYRYCDADVDEVDEFVDKLIENDKPENNKPFNIKNTLEEIDFNYIDKMNITNVGILNEELVDQVEKNKTFKVVRTELLKDLGEEHNYKDVGYDTIYKFKKMLEGTADYTMFKARKLNSRLLESEFAHLIEDIVNRNIDKELEDKKNDSVKEFRELISNIDSTMNNEQIGMVIQEDRAKINKSHKKDQKNNVKKSIIEIDF